MGKLETFTRKETLENNLGQQIQANGIHHQESNGGTAVAATTYDLNTQCQNKTRSGTSTTDACKSNHSHHSKLETTVERIKYGLKVENPCKRLGAGVGV